MKQQEHPLPEECDNPPHTETSHSSAHELNPPTAIGTDKLDLILKKIRDSRAAIELQIGTLSTNLTLLKADHDKLTDKVKDHKILLDDLVPQQTATTAQLDQVKRQLKGMQEKLDDAEGRSRRNNVRILGIPERSEGTNPTQFIEDWLRDTVVKEGLSQLYAVERAHRVPPRQPRPGAPPSPIIARILNYRDRDTILRAARENAPLQFENKRISIYPDFTMAVQKARNTFREVKKTLQTQFKICHVISSAAEGDIQLKIPIF